MDSRKDDAKVIESLNMNETFPMESDDYFQGGISNHGDFKEGFCFKLRMLTVNKENLYIICSSSRVFIIINSIG